jgi:hypothetical protein
MAPKPARRLDPTPLADQVELPNGEFAAQAPQVLGFTTRAALREALGSAPRATAARPTGSAMSRPDMVRSLIPVMGGPL